MFWKFLYFACNVFLFGYVTYLTIFKADSTLKDAMFVLWLCYFDLAVVHSQVKELIAKNKL